MSNGQNDTILFWLGHNLWAIITAAVAVIWWIGRKLRTRDQIKEDIREAVQPLHKELSKLSKSFGDHASLPAHPVSYEKMRGLEILLNEVRGDLKELLKIARNGGKSS